MTKQKKAALYIRVSTRYQIDKDSLPFQKQKLIDYCEFMGIKDYEVYADEGFSGKNTDRPGFQRMMSELRNGNISHIIVWKVDRISRNLLDFAAMYTELKKYRVTFVSMNEQFDTSSAIGEAMLKIILVFAELERNMTSERVTSIMLNRAEHGQWNGARMPMGYKWDDNIKFPIPDEEESKTVQFIFDKYEEVHSCLTVSRYLNNNNIKTKRGGKWTSKTVNDIIKNPFYIGTYRYNVRESARGKMKPKSEWIVKENNHTPIIEKDQFERCAAIIQSNLKRDTSEYRRTNYVHVFSHLLKCGKCGSGFCSQKDKVRANGYRPSMYRCAKRMHMKDCEQKIINDTTIGNFVFNYISNVVRAQKDFSKINSLDKFEKSLLKGTVFEDISKIEEAGLQQMYNAILYNSATSNSLNFDFLSNAPADNNTAEIILLTKEKEKYTKAVDRLLDIYLYDSEAVSKDEFTKKQRDLQSKIDGIDEKIENLKSSEANNKNLNPLDTSFIKKATAFLVSQKILSARYIDFVDLALNSDPQILKDFISQIIEYITVDENKVTKIKFINGIEHSFIRK